MSDRTYSVEEFRRIENASKSEEYLQLEVNRLLDKWGWFHFHRSDKADKLLAKLNMHKLMSRGKGFFDVFAMKNGCILLIELKTQSGKLAPEQKMVREEAIRVQHRVRHVNADPYQCPVQYYNWRTEDLHNGTIEETLMKAGRAV